MSEDGRRQLPLNPFSPTAVAKVSDSGAMISVPTPSTEEALRYLDGYLQATGERQPGYVLAIQGDYGSGKTHLASMLLDRVREWAEADPARSARPVYLDAADKFVDLYERFVKRLPENEVYAEVREYYADTIAERLGDDEVSAQVRALLRSPGADLEEVGSTLGLSEYGLVRALRSKLADVTNDESFATVLSLLVRPGFERHAWHWLAGGEPHPLLVERGVDTRIDNETAAIEALSVFALLYGHRGHRFVLVVDELGKLIPSAPAEDGTLAAFQKLLESFESANAMLVLVGLSEALDLLVGGIRQRVSAFITMAPFDVPAATRFIELSIDRVRDWDGDPLYPFTARAIEEIVSLTYGNPRKIGLYCRQLYREATRKHGRPAAITAAQVRAVAREHFGTGKRPQVAIEVQAALEAQRWLYHRDYYVTAEPGSKVDYWVVAGESGCALFLAGSVIEPEDAAELTRRVRSVREKSHCETLLIVSEALAAEHRKTLTDAFGREPLVYRQGTFADDLTALVKSLRHRLDQASGGDTLAGLRDKFDRFASYQSQLQDSVEQVMAGIRDLGISSDRKLGDLRRDLDELSRTVTAVIRWAGRDRGTEPGLPDDVAELFDRRLADLDALEVVPGVVDRLFTEQAAGLAAARQTLEEVRFVTQHGEQSAAGAFGVTTMLRALLASFRRAVSEWFRSSAPSPGGRLRPVELGQLEVLCETYDAVYESLPTFELESLNRLAGPEDRVQSAERLRRVRQEFETLAVDVRQAVIAFFPR